MPDPHWYRWRDTRHNQLTMRVLLVEDEPAATWVVETGLRERGSVVDGHPVQLGQEP